MNRGFSGEVADFYSRYRRGYPPSAIQAVVDVFALTHHDVVVDLGCGTGQLTLPMASRVRAALGVDPEPDMLMHARRTADQQGVSNASWMIGTDADMPAIGQLLGARSVGAVTVAQALHWMAPQTLFTTLTSVIRPGGGVAVMSNGTPLWLQETVWISNNCSAASTRRCPSSGYRPRTSEPTSKNASARPCTRRPDSPNRSMSSS
jgi:ubiquinone/menaquinone biosynthesis C-methylase UbiE